MPMQETHPEPPAGTASLPPKQPGRIADFVSRASRSTLVRNSGWLFAGQGLSFVIQGLYFVVLARLLGTRQYGLLAGAIALVGVVSQYSTLGSGLLFMRYVTPDHSHFRLYWGNVLLSVSLMGTLLVIGLRLFGSSLIGRESVAILTPIAIGDCLFQQFNGCTSQVFGAFERMRTSASLNLLSNLLRLILAVTLMLVLGHATAWQWALGSMSVSLVAAVIAFVSVTRAFGWPSFSVPLLFRRASEGFVFAVSGSTTAVYNDIDKVMLSRAGMIQANGIYSMAYRVINIGAMPIWSVISAAFPRFFREGAKGIAATVPMARQLLRRIIGLGALISVGLFVIAPIIPHLVGHSFDQSVSALRWLCLIPLFRCFHLSAGDAIAGAGYQRFRLLSQSVAALSNFGMNVYLIPRYGWLGAAWASLATDGGLGVMNWVALLYLARRSPSVPLVA